MKAILLASLVSFASATVSHETFSQFQQWKLAHGKKYSESEEATRLSNFAANAKKIAALNAAEAAVGGATFQHNAFSAHSEAEMKRRRGVKGLESAVRANTTVGRVAKVAAPASADWRTRGVLAPIQDQGQCGSCWAFSATATLEAQKAIKTGTSPIKLSEQWLVDCDHQCGSYRVESGCDGGCEGGLQPNAWVFTKKAGGQPLETAYPYTAADGTCQSGMTGVTAPTSWEFACNTFDEVALAAYVAANGPVSVALNAENWSYYSGGIMQSQDVCPTVGSRSNPTPIWDTLDHGVNIVGYGTSGGVDFWIIRNSWAASWGENGYARILRGTNFCGVSMFAARAIA